MINAHVERSIILKTFLMCKIPRVNWGAFIDDNTDAINNIYHKIDDELAFTFRRICTSHL